MNRKKINWKVQNQEINQDITSEDNRWHISRKQKGHYDPTLFLTNYDLLLTPHGTGKDYQECFQTFIQNCDEFVNKIQQIKAEAKAHLEELQKAERALENDN